MAGTTVVLGLGGLGFNAAALAGVVGLGLAAFANQRGPGLYRSHGKSKGKHHHHHHHGRYSTN